MRRAVAVLLGAAALLLPLGAAHAAEETPQGRFSSPTRATAGAPMWIRSVTPCPVTGAYEWVRVGIKPQTDPDADTYFESTDGDLRPDGSWEVTMSAPSDMPNGITKAYSVHVQCIRHEAPYAVPDRDPSNTTTTLNPEFSYFRYFLRPLHVTGFGGADADSDPAGDEDADEDDDGDDTTTTTATPTTTTTALTTATTAALTTSANRAERMDPALLKLDEARRAAEARAELAALDDDQDADERDVTLVASSERPQRPSDGGIPWWSFVAATMLAVGAVIAWGARRSASVAG